MSWALNNVILSPDEAEVFRRKVLPACDDVIVEIGFGNGEFLLDMASRDKRGFYFGIEVSMTSMLKAARKCLALYLSNVRLLFGDGSFLLREFFLPESVDKVYVNFPCPWPKKRHAKRRLVTPDFACNLAHALKVGGFFELASDELWYVEDARRCLLENPAFAVDEVAVGKDSSFRTKYEEKWISMGKSIYRLKAAKGMPFRAEPVADWEAVALNVKAKKTGEWNASRLNCLFGLTGGDERFRWTFKDLFFGSEGVCLLQAITVDDGFEQKFYIRIVPGEDEVLIKLDDASSVYRTPAVKKSFAALAEEIERL